MLASQVYVLKLDSTYVAVFVVFILPLYVINSYMDM